MLPGNRKHAFINYNDILPINFVWDFRNAKTFLWCFHATKLVNYQDLYMFFPPYYLFFFSELFLLIFLNFFFWTFLKSWYFFSTLFLLSENQGKIRWRQQAINISHAWDCRSILTEWSNGGADRDVVAVAIAIAILSSKRCYIAYIYILSLFWILIVYLFRWITQINVLSSNAISSSYLLHNGYLGANVGSTKFDTIFCFLVLFFPLTSIWAKVGKKK